MAFFRNAMSFEIFSPNLEMVAIAAESVSSAGLMTPFPSNENRASQSGFNGEISKFGSNQSAFRLPQWRGSPLDAKLLCLRASW